MEQVPTLQTERLILRPLIREDVDAVRALGGNRRVAEMTLLPHPFEREAAERWVEARVEKAEKGELLPFSLILRDGAEVCGHLGLVLDPENEAAELYYWLGFSYWGRGYATEAAREALRYAFEELGLRRVYADCFARNSASQRVLQKVGMSKEGLLKQHIKKWDHFEDLALYAVLVDEWQAAGWSSG